MLFQSRSLEDVHDHGLAIAGWRQVYRQMTPGRFKGTVTQVLYDDFHFFRETTNRRVAQTGVSPEGRTSLAVPVLAPLSGTFQRRHVDGYALLALRPGEDFEFHTPEGMRLVGISAAPDMIDELCEAEFGTRDNRAPRHVIRLTDEQGAALGARLSSHIDDAQRNPAWLEYDATRKMFRDAMLGVFLDALAGAVGDERRDITHATYSDIVGRCERYLWARPEEPVTVLELCRALRCSRRTLQTSFQRVADVTPVTYLRTIRLNAVRRLLRTTSADALGVGEAAARWGFTHLGYFAREYRGLFGELPSQTRRLS
ncbi:MULTISPECIES: helix-turn-helix domain-containing protein [Burkholderia]|uniref:Helix-turn-helix domain-containing protein n=2 Tax=Burkholderia humptydooensis TaxID=430531 RepID=A0A7U4PAE4_9BURK|nr:MULTISPECIES: helix-turn-helix domain-containing protein [Burkholderia]AJY39138.1 helix-turn-helix domain protein [Burkholderia sp. 2002721687]ALX45930.1 AraC family transcriptional regulator [Burkholderia humptydooensis]KVN16735.1 AraC family transcriptional regulator [Burkholderia sp. MSMB1552]KWZ51137.1 AraC family transcriptional regulator [Burkholderia sp. MSMB1588]QPS47421.1 helix-turn-helix domain-containing protein [Burkholderia humptydooensis]